MQLRSRLAVRTGSRRALPCKGDSERQRLREEGGVDFSSQVPIRTQLYDSVNANSDGGGISAKRHWNIQL